jgi:hypothetical protein
MIFSVRFNLRLFYYLTDSSSFVRLNRIEMIHDAPEKINSRMDSYYRKIFI